jgi:hypothetical protein
MMGKNVHSCYRDVKIIRGALEKHYTTISSKGDLNPVSKHPGNQWLYKPVILNFLPIWKVKHLCSPATVRYQVFHCCSKRGKHHHGLGDTFTTKNNSIRLKILTEKIELVNKN